MRRSKHSLSHYHILTGDMGKLIPITWYEALPGDTIQHRVAALIRVSPLLAPIMHPVQVRIHNFFVPNRLIWDNSGGAETGWEAFITGGSDGTKTPTHPYRTFGTPTESELADYLGLTPAAHSPNFTVSALPFRCYSMIWNEFYRDQDLETELTIDKTDGSDTTTNTSLQNVSWEKDYFTASRPWEQKGNTVTIPLGTSAPVESAGTGAAGTPTFDGAGSGVGVALQSGATNPASSGDLEWNDPKLVADLSSATGIDVNDLRLALSLQRYQEARAKFGSRYVEYLRYLGVRSSDSRLQNPEYLGGAKQTIQFSEVLSTDGSNTGDLKGHGISAVRSPRFRRFFEEHGIVMTMMSIVPKAVYTQGHHKSWHRTTKEDYFQKELQFIGEQAVENKEVYSLHTTPDGTFSYQSRYDEYRSLPSRVSGEFYSSNNHWHLGRIFAADPALNSTFVSCNPTKRVLASSSTDSMYIMTNHSIQARRLLAKTAINKTI